MLEKIPIDGDVDAFDGQGGGVEPNGIGMTGRFPRGALVQAQDIGDNLGAFLSESLGGQADRTLEAV
jgi:hypothetical protein